MQYRISQSGKKSRRASSAGLDQYLKELMQTDGGDYARYLASEGALTPDAGAKLSEATLTAARERADYGRQREALAEEGLLHSGYADYLENAALGRGRAARDTVAKENAVIAQGGTATGATGTDTQRRTVLSALRSAGFTSVEDATAYAKLLGLSDKDADEVAAAAVNSVRNSQSRKDAFIKTCVSMDFRYQQSLGYAYALGFTPEEAEELASLVQKYQDIRFQKK